MGIKKKICCNFSGPPIVGKQIDLSTTKPVLSIAEREKEDFFLVFFGVVVSFVVFCLKIMPVRFTARKSNLALRWLRALH
jgi:hypothetical protein